MGAGQPVWKMIRKQVDHNALLFKQADCRFYLRILRLNRQSHEDLVYHVVGNNAWQIMNVTEPGNALETMTVEVCFVVNIANDAIAQISTLSDLVSKPASSRSTTNNQQGLDIV